MQKFTIPPDKASYTMKDGQEVLSVQLQGGAARYRRDIANPTARVTANWTMGMDGYLYIRSFFRAAIDNGASPFLMDLILDLPTLTEHKCYFVPNTLTLNSQSGLTYSVSVDLEVYPQNDPIPFAQDYVDVYNEFGNTFRYYEDVLDMLMNTAWPEVYN